MQGAESFLYKEERGGEKSEISSLKLGRENASDSFLNRSQDLLTAEDKGRRWETVLKHEICVGDSSRSKLPRAEAKNRISKEVVSQDKEQVL